ncbi:TUDOR-SN protein 1 isoform 2 [Quillaja saponaria]|uniref:TUDOR-SN protein 1 isoform 2 n=1 Tax=Quillaja saponaria TaxID=32244 RepID=A0AAD7L819_QUISA|nr:TUDOR-SN protein 1 isoform 2 [Quillaja saponaria]
MANHGVGNKFVSVNLNKSYGQNSHHHSTSYGSNRTRPSSHGGGGGGMVVLSRPRSSQKAGPKLSVPPPLNLPSLRKEHERFDTLGSGGGPAGGGASGTGSRPTSSGMGWTKPGPVPLQEKEATSEQTLDGFDQGPHSVDGLSMVSSVYMPPAARPGMVGQPASASSQAYPIVEKVSVLRGEDFPSLQATLPSSSGPAQKSKENLNQKHKLVVGDNVSNDQRDSSRLSSLVDRPSQLYISHNSVSNGLHENDGGSHRFGSSKASELARKQEEYFPGPLPLVRFNPRSDWADDERDTSHGLTARTREGRDHGFSKSEPYWDRAFDMPRVNVLPQKPVHNFDRWDQHDNDSRKVSAGEVHKVDPYIRTPSREGREGSSWRKSPLSKDGFSAQHVGNDRNGIVARPFNVNKELGQENKYAPSPSRETVHDDNVKKDIGYGHGGRQPWNYKVESYGSRGPERNIRDCYGAEQHNRYRGDSLQNSSVSKSSFSSGGKGLPVNDPLLNFGNYLKLNLKGFRSCKNRSGYGSLKNKKEPIELARKEEEERMRFAREQEERRRRLEEEAREAAWRAEQEQVEALRKAEEQRIEREEEKRRVFLEEERRKQAAKQKLLELEERIARRQAEAAKGSSNSSVTVDEKMSSMMNERDVARAADVGDWEDGERMVERLTTSASSDSSSLSRPLEMGSRPHFSRDSSSTFTDRGKPVNSWRRDAYENGSSSAFYLQDQDNGHHNPRRDSSVGGKVFPRKESYGGVGLMSSRTYHKVGFSDPQEDEFPHMKGHRWNLSGDGDHYSRTTEIDPEFHDNFVERFGEAGWGQGRPSASPYSSYPERSFLNSESDGPYAFGRSRYSMKQPRVLPPPLISSVHKSYRGGNERAGPSNFLDSEVHKRILRTEDRKVDHNTTQRCDSQSSLSVSSPFNSPTHLSHDDLDESGESLVLSAGEGKNILVSGQGNESIVLPSRAGIENANVSSCSVSTGDDEEWTIETNEQLQEQEEYDEDEDGYEEEDEVHEGDDNVTINQELEDLHLEEKTLPNMMDNLVLGFDEGVQVGMPTEEFESTLKKDDSTFAMKHVSVVTLEEQMSFDYVGTDGKTRQLVEDSSQVSVGSSSRVFQETENTTLDLVNHPSNAHSCASGEIIDYVEASSSGLSAHHPLPPSVNSVSQSSGQSFMSASPAVPNQAELPIKLQFGLFSGPSLIPSPVPAIQIGSIQMPLHLHSQVGPSLTHMHPSQSPLFQFGQLRYTSPISQGLVSLAPQTMSFVQPNIPSSFSLNQNPGGPVPVQTGQDTSADAFGKNEVMSHSLDNQQAFSRHLDLSQGTTAADINTLTARQNVENIAVIQQGRGEISHVGDGDRSMSGFHTEERGYQNSALRSSSNAREPGGLSQTRAGSLLSASEENGSKAQNPVSGGRSKRYVVTVKNSGSRSSGLASRSNRSDWIGFPRRPRRNIQRTEFRVREGTEKRQSSGLVSAENFGLDNKSNINGRGTEISARSGHRKVVLSNKMVKQTVEAACLNSDVDAPLQSGIVRVFEQPGIEAPSDEDDFIEVRSKRQMLNDRREQREKEIKAKSRFSKLPRKSRSTFQGSTVLANSSKISTSMGGEAATGSRSDFFAPERRGLATIEVSSGFNATIVSQPLAPIGTPPLKIDGQADIRSHTSRSLPTSLPVVSGGGKIPVPGLIMRARIRFLITPKHLWPLGVIHILVNSFSVVMALTQTQLDEAMKPQQFDSHASVGDHTSAVSEPSLPSSSILTKEKLFSSAASPINSLLAGEKIQFGAVTSPTVLPPGSHSVSNGIGSLGPSQPDIQISHNLAGSDNSCSLFFGKGKHSNEPCSHLEDSEAEAAASAVAVAAISSDEIVGNGLGTCSVSVSETKSFRGEDIDGIPAGVASDQQSASQSRAEEPFSVTLPADLSVETPPISLWPPLPSPQNSSNQMLSHFPTGPPSHFPFYEMNPLLGGPIFAFGPHDDSASSAQSQSQKSSGPASRPLGSWQQCHSGVDSFYGPPAGFTGPFISPPGGIPGVQGPPHMVVYNHFAPVGQFGQVGLSFMGTTYIPSGKQPDWKHNPPTSTMGVCEGDINNINMAGAQRNPNINMPAPIQHLAPGSPLLPMASPLAMFDVSSFQSSPEMPVQARWPHIPTSPPLQSIPLSMPMQQQAEVHTTQFRHGSSVTQALGVNRFPDSQTSTPPGSDQSFSTATDVKVTHLPDELGLVDPSSSAATKALGQTVDNKSSSISSVSVAAKADVQNGNSSNTGGQNSSSAFKNQTSQHKHVSSHQYTHSSAYGGYQRGSGVSQKNNSGGDWSHRRVGFHGRNQSLGAEKSIPSSKMKQIYVAKQTMSGSSTVS